MAEKIDLDKVEMLVADVHDHFYALLQIYKDDPIEHRASVESGIREFFLGRNGWDSESDGHFVYQNGMNLYIDPVTPPSTWSLIRDTARLVLRIELEDIVEGAPDIKTMIIGDAVDRLISDYDWDIVFPRRRIAKPDQ